MKQLAKLFKIFRNRKVLVLLGLLCLLSLLGLLSFLRYSSPSTPAFKVKSVNAQTQPDKFLLKKSDILTIYPELESQFKSGEYLPYIYSTDKDQPFVLTKSSDSIQKHIFSTSSLEVRLEEYNPKSKVFESKGISKPIYQYQKDKEWFNFSLNSTVTYNTKQINDTLILTQNQNTASIVWEIGIKNDSPILKNTFKLTAPTSTNRLVWQIAFPGQYAEELKNIEVKPESKFFKLSDIEIGWGDFLETSKATLNFSQNALEITFLPDGKSGNLEIDPTFSTSVGATYIEVDDGTRYWCFGPGPDSTTNQRFFQPSLFYHSSTGDPTACNSGGDNLLPGSRTGDQSGYDGFFDGETSLADGATNVLRLLENTPSRVMIQVYRNTVVDSKATYTIYPNGFGYTSYQFGTATEHTTPGLFIHYDQSNTTPQLSNLDTTNNTWVVSDTSNSNYAGLAYIPFALDSATDLNDFDTSTSSDYYGYYTVGTGYHDYIDDYADMVYLADWSTYRGTTYTRDRKREDYRSPANLQSNITGGQIWDQNSNTSRIASSGFEGADSDLCGGGDGWTSGSCNADDTAIGNYSSDAYLGNYSARFTGGVTTTDEAYSELSFASSGANSTSVRLAFKIRSETLGNNQSITLVELLESSSSTTDQNLEIRQNASGQLVLCILDNNNTRTCGSSVLNTNTWYEVTLDQNSNLVGRIELFLNGKSETSISGVSVVSIADSDRLRIGLVDSSTAQNDILVDNVAFNYTSTGPSFFNPREGVYTVRHNWQGDLTVKLDRSGLIASGSAMLISNWRSLNDPGSVLLNSSALSDTTDYNSDVLPISEAWVNDSDGVCGTSGWQRLAEGGDTSDTEEYLSDPSDNFSFQNGGGSSNCTWGDSATDALYFGRHDRFTGLNTQLSTNGIGTPTVTWEYCSVNTDVATACDTWTSLTVGESVTGASTFTDSGTIFWTWPSQPLRSTENSGREALYYVRARVTAGSYSTYPVESVIKSDLLIFQHLGTLTGLSNFTFKQQQVASWRINEAAGTTLNDALGTNHLTTNGPTWNLDGSPTSNRYTSLRFDGSNDFASQTNDTDFNFGNGSFSVTGWFKHPSAVTGTDVLFSRASAINGIGYKVYMNSSGNLCFGIDDDTTSFPEDSACSTSTFIDSSWHHFSAVKTRTNRIDLYIDGKLVASDTTISATGSLDASATLYLGIDADGTSNPWDGFIDEVSVYSIPMTTTQVLADLQDPSSALVGASATDPLTNGLVGYWKMDDNTGTNSTDASGNSYTGTLNGNTWGIGRFGHGLSFDGNDYVDISTSSINPANNFTISAWINPTNLSADRTILGMSTGTSFIFNVTTTGALNTYCGTTDLNSNTGVVVAGSWQHVAVTKTGTNTFAYYVNGVNVTNGTSGDTGCGSLTNAHIGRFFSTYFLGSMDEVRTYNRALTPKEIEQLYNYAPPPTFYLNADTNTGTTVYNTGTVGDTSGFDSADMRWTQGKFGPGVETILNTSSTGSGIGFSNGSSHISSTSRSFTISGYFNIKNATGLSYWFEQPIIARMASTNSGGCTTQSGLMAEARSATSVYIHASLAYQSAGSSCNQTTDVGYGTNQVTVGQWNHVALTYNGSNNQMQLFLNGVLVESATWGGSGNWTFIDDGFYIGNYGTTSNSMNIAIDEIKSYNYVRTPKQIIEDMNGGHPAGGSPVASQTVYYAMDESNGTTLNNSNSALSSLTSSVSGATWLSPSSCKLSTCLNFDGTDDVSTTTNTSSIDLNNNLASGFTISTWFWADTDGEADTGQIFQKGTNTYCRTDSESGGRVDIECSLDLATSDATLNISSAVATNSWNHLAVSYTDDSDDEITIWINGKNLGSSTNGSGAPAAESSNLLIGGTTTANFDGRIDEFKVYSSELSSSEIMVDMNAGSSMSAGVLGSQDNEGFGGNPPVGQWNLNENTGSNALDTSGNNYTAAITNAIWSQGKVGSALRFDGSGDYATVTAPANLSITNWTLNAWIYPTSIGAFKTIFWKGGGGADQSNYDLQINTGGTVLCEFQQTVTGNWNSCESSGVVVANEWQHVSCTKNGSDVRLYRNGSQIQSCTLTDTPTTDSSRNLGIGRDITNSANDWPGLLDQLQIYNYARTPAQIAYDYNRGKPLLWYKFDECSGSTTYDSSGRGINGTITPGATGNTATGSCGSGVSTEMWNDGTTGKFNSALGFDAASDYVQSANSPGLPTNDFTYSAWVYPNVNSPDRLLMAADGSGNNEISISIGGCSTAKICVDLNGGASTASTQSVTPLTWSHIVVTRSGSTITMYLNGKPDPTTITDSTTLNFSTCPLMIGTDVDSGCTGSLGNWFDGLIDEVQVYNYAMTTNQVKTLYNQSSSVQFGPQTGAP